MCKLILYITVFFVSIFFYSCEKYTFNIPSPNASLSVIHAAMDLPSVNVNLTDPRGPFYTFQQPISYGSSFEWGLPAGNVPVIIISSADTNNSILNTKFDLKPSGIYSLYILDESAKTSTLLLEDTIPAHSDSAAGARFINLIEGSQPMTVNLQDNPFTQTEFSNIGYKQITTFKSYMGAGGITGYNFEIHDQQSGDLLATFYWNFILYKNYTIVISGDQSNISVFQVNNY